MTFAFTPINALSLRTAPGAGASESLSPVMNAPAAPPGSPPS